MYCFFCFKQKTAYEMRISDWSSDVCSSDLGVAIGASISCAGACMTLVDKGSADGGGWFAVDVSDESLSRTSIGTWVVGTGINLEIGRASCRERVCQYV